MQRPEISFSFLSTQLCRNCRSPITCSPVYVLEDLSILCGRCKMLAKDHYRNYSYEALASVFIYPCKNWRNHCPARLLWNESAEHEENCNYIGCCCFFCCHPGACLKGKRDIPEDETRLTTIPEGLLDRLTCVLCDGYLNCDPVYLQVNGENVCHRCINSNGTPPNCRRNYAYEQISKIFIFPCSFRNRGCPERMQFGRPLWQHEFECPYGQAYLKKHSEARQPSIRQRQNGDYPITTEPKAEGKKRGVITTHSGHIFATITPNKALFAPPDDVNDAQHKEFLKSIAKKQERQIRRADELGNEIGGRGSDSESLSTNESFSIKNSVGQYENGSLDILEDTRRPLPPIPSEDSRQPYYVNRPNSRESGYNSYPPQNGYPLDNLSEEGSVRQSNGPSSRESYLAGQFDGHTAGHYPVMMPHSLNDDVGSINQRMSIRDSINDNYRESFRESFPQNRLLISELKIRQNMIKKTHSIRGNVDSSSPFKDCKSLNDVQEVHNQLR